MEHFMINKQETVSIPAIHPTTSSQSSLSPARLPFKSLLVLELALQEHLQTLKADAKTALFPIATAVL